MRRFPNFGYHFGRASGRTAREIYRALLPLLISTPVRPRRAIPLDVYSYSGEATLPEQVVSVRSFLRYAGRPRSFNVMSDGSHEERSKRWLEQIDSCVSVEVASRVPVSGPERLQHYLRNHPTGKQLAVIMSLPANGPALYIDSDVRFFPGAFDLARQAAASNTSAFYLPDCQFAGDRRLLRGAAEEARPVNTGVLLLFQPLDWSLSIERFLALEGEPDFFTNQTMTHLTMHQNGARPLDPARYVLQLDDQFIFPDRYADEALALRHYVNPVRHKFWQNLSA